MSSGWLNWGWFLIRMSYGNVIMSSGWDTLPFLSHPDEIANFDFPHHAVALQRFRNNAQTNRSVQKIHKSKQTLGQDLIVSNPPWSLSSPFTITTSTTATTTKLLKWNQNNSAKHFSMFTSHPSRAKWLSFRRRHLQMHFHERKVYFYSNFT